MPPKGETNMKKLLITLLFLALLPSVSLAETKEEQISRLQAQLIVLYTELIQLLQGQINQPIVVEHHSGSYSAQSTPVQASIEPQMQQYFYNVQFQDITLSLSATTPIDMATFTLGGISASSSEHWTPPVGNTLCQNFNSDTQSFKGCTNTNSLFIYNFTYESVDKSLPISFTTVDGRSVNDGIKSN